MTKKKTEPGAAPADAEVRVLVDCWAGRAGRTVRLPVEDVKRLIAEGCGDDHPSAIAAGKE